MRYLVETALLTHGLCSVTQEELLRQWSVPQAKLAWVEQGRIVSGTTAEYLPLRARAGEACRISADTLEDALREGRTGALTASGTLAVCHRQQIPLAVTCGMGGIGEMRGAGICPDLPALARYGTALLANIRLAEAL